MKTLSLLLLLLSPSTVQAQYSVPSGGALGAGFVYVTANGDDFEGTEAGPGFQASLRYTAPKGGTINFAVQFSSHDVEGLDDNIHLLALLVEPGYTARIPKSSVAPFIRARLGYVRETLSSLGVDADANGFVGGAVGGILFQVGPQIGIETDVARSHAGVD